MVQGRGRVKRCRGRVAPDYYVGDFSPLPSVNFLVHFPLEVE